MPHVHVGFVEFLTLAAMLLIFTFLWRSLTGYLNTRHPQAASVLAGLYS